MSPPYRYVPSASKRRVDVVMAEILGDHASDMKANKKNAGSLSLPSSGSNSGTSNGTGGNGNGDGDIVLTKEAWCNAMASWLQSNSERRHNLIVVVPSTPAQYFHCLRRQIHRPYSKPVIVMSPKWLLHHRACTSRWADMGPGTYFHRVILEGGRGDNTLDIKGTADGGGSVNNSDSDGNGDNKVFLLEPGDPSLPCFTRYPLFFNQLILTCALNAFALLSY